MHMSVAFRVGTVLAGSLYDCVIEGRAVLCYSICVDGIFDYVVIVVFAGFDEGYWMFFLFLLAACIFLGNEVYNDFDL